MDLWDLGFRCKLDCVDVFIVHYMILDFGFIAFRGLGLMGFRVRVGGSWGLVRRAWGVGFMRLLGLGAPVGL